MPPSGQEWPTRPAHRIFKPADSLHFHTGADIIDHPTSQTVKHEPGSPILASYLAFQLLGAEARPMGRYQISRPEPLLNAHMATMHRRASHRRCASAARGALIPKGLPDHPVLPAAAAGADESLRPPAFRQVLPAGCIRRESAPKFLQGSRKSWASHEGMVQDGGTLVKYIGIYGSQK